MEEGEDHPDTLAVKTRLGSLYLKQGREEEAESVHFEVLETRKRILGEDHPDTVASMHNLALVYADQARYAEAERRHKMHTAQMEKFAAAEAAGHGGAVAAPIAVAVLRYYFKEISPPKPDTTQGDDS